MRDCILVFGEMKVFWNESQVTLINEVSNITDFTEHYRCKQMTLSSIKEEKNGKCFQSSQRVS